MIDYFRLRGDRAIRSYLDLKLAREQTWIWMRKHSVSPADMDLSARMTAMYILTVPGVPFATRLERDGGDHRVPLVIDYFRLRRDRAAFRWLLSHPYNRHGR